MTTRVGGIRSANMIFFDDSSTELINGQINRKVSEAIAALDRQQDKDNLTPFRPELVISTIRSWDSNTNNGWYLNLNDNNLIFIQSGAITDTYVPKIGDTIKIKNLRKDFTGTEWIDFTGASPYWLEPVSTIVESLPEPSLFLEGDRLLLNSTPPTIQTLVDGAWQEKDMPDGASVRVKSFGGFYTRIGSKLEYAVPIIQGVRVPNICDNNYPLGQEWSFEGKIYKAIANEQLGSETEIIGQLNTVGSQVDVKNVFGNQNIGESWQTFTPSITGGLTSFKLPGIASKPVPLHFKLYRGGGINGELLYEYQTVYPANQFNPQIILDCPYGLEVGQKYSWSIAETTPNGLGLKLYAAEHLENEQSDISSDDYKFEITIAPATGIKWSPLAIQGALITSSPKFSGIKSQVETEDLPQSITIEPGETKKIALVFSNMLAIPRVTFIPHGSENSQELQVKEVEYKNGELILDLPATSEDGCFSTAETGDYDLIINLDQCLEYQYSNILSIKNIPYLDLRAEGTTLNDGDVIFAPRLNLNQDATGMFLNSDQGWDTWAYFPVLEHQRSQPKTYEWIFTHTSGSMMIGIGGKNFDRQTTRVFYEAEIFAYFSSPTSFSRFYGDQGSGGTSHSLSATAVKKLVLEHNGEGGHKYYIYELPDSESWKDTSNLQASGIIPSVFRQDDNIIAPFFSCNNSTHRLIAVRVK